MLPQRRDGRAQVHTAIRMCLIPVNQSSLGITWVWVGYDEMQFVIVPDLLANISLNVGSQESRILQRNVPE